MNRLPASAESRMSAEPGSAAAVMPSTACSAAGATHDIVGNAALKAGTDLPEVDRLPQMPTNVLLLRGHHPTVWGLRPFERLPERFDVRVAVTHTPRYSLDGLQLQRVPVRTVRDSIPGGTLASVVTLALP